ncbi:peroxisomal membrane protein 2 [Sitodiplosis mosellana]|uniref:peroxisomal membrane protein 2 n=1 Tax=Sitodiplosis mosellana TaxID=263140 RepID=UPI00244413BB|nr:peroxisomal membrane protein 2 [Sitodiplosis mosellana]
MSLSKPLFNALSFYLEQLFMHPLRTKSITSCVLASSANVVSQKLMGHKEINQQSLFAYALFGLLFGGSMPHYFYKIMEKTLVGRTKLNQILFFACERLIYTPLFQALSLFCLSIFEGKSQEAALQNLFTLYWPVLKANWTYLSLLVFINIRFVPPIFRVLIGNLIGFGWVIFLTMKRRKLQNQLDTAKNTRIVVTDSDSSSGTGGATKKRKSKDSN